MPRVKNDSERGYIGAWMRRERLRLGLSPEQVVDLLPQRVRPDYYRQLESGAGGKHPSAELQASLERIFNSRAEPPPPAESEDLAGAIRAQTMAMLQLVAQMELDRAARQGLAEGLAAALGDLASTLERLRLAPFGESRRNG